MFAHSFYLTITNAGQVSQIHIKSSLYEKCILVELLVLSKIEKKITKQIARKIFDKVSKNVRL